MERHDAEPKKGIGSNATKNMFSVVEQVNAGYGKYFDAKPKTSTIRSECYINYKTCGSTTSSKDIPKQCVGINDEGSKSEDNNSPINNRDIIQEVCDIRSKNVVNKPKKRFSSSVLSTTCC